MNQTLRAILHRAQALSRCKKGDSNLDQDLAYTELIIRNLSREVFA